MKTKAATKKTARRPAANAAALRRVFTVRDLNRQPQAVLNAARKTGGVHVQSRSGERFLVKPDPLPGSSQADSREEFHRDLMKLHEQMRADGMGFTVEGWETFSKILAGE